jgi:predicted amidophosphoribosyltransferase
LAGSFDIITWVPLSPRRHRKRGYSQARLLAEAAAAELGVGDCEELLKKRRNTPAQSAIKGRAERRANVSGAFEALRRGGLAGKRILLIDDVVTSGATLWSVRACY